MSMLCVSSSWYLGFVYENKLCDFGVSCSLICKVVHKKNRQSARVVVNPITVCFYALLFNCTTVGKVSDSMTFSVIKLGSLHAS